MLCLLLPDIDDFVVEYIRIYFSLNKADMILREGKLIKGKLIKVLAESLYKDGLWGKFYKA